MITKPSFGHWLKQRRKALDLTQEMLAQQVGCTVSALYKFEADERRPSRQIAELLAEHLNIPVDERPAFVSFARSKTISSAAPWGTPFHPPTNLSASPTLLIGREEDAAILCKRLLQPETRLLTLVGAPGIGKTRLATEAALRVLDDFADGVFFVALAPVSDANLVFATIATTLSIAEMGPHTALERVKAFLRDKQMLLVLDNFEQLLSAAPQVAELLGTCAWLKILVTSRAPLRLRQERQSPVTPLALPNLSQSLDPATVADSAAVTLFMERAQAVKPDFVLTEASAPTIAALCVRLDGLPLAIELISARVKLLPPATLLERLHGRLMLQSDGLRDIEPRHRTLNNAIDWSYQLLSTKEQMLFRRLAVFVGGWTLEAASAVCMENLTLNLLDGLASLLDKSLIKQALPSDAEPRFLMLETIREYALERLTASEELETLQRQHAACFAALAETNQAGMTGAQQALWWERLELEQANFRAALTWSHVGSSCETELSFMLAFSDFWRLHGHLGEGSMWLTNALERQTNESVSALTEVENRIRAMALSWLSLFHQWKGTLDLGQPHLEESLALFRELDDTEAVADALGSYGMLFVLRGDYEHASLHLNESMALWRQVDSPMGIAVTLLFLGNLAYSQGLTTRAGELWEEALELYRPLLDAQWVISTVLAQLAMVAVDQSNFEQARVQLTESLMILHEMGERWQIVHSLEVYACFIAVQAQRLEEMRRAAQIFGAAEKLRETIASPVFPFQQRFNQRGLAALQAKYDEAALRAAWGEGRAMMLDQVVADALEQTNSRFTGTQKYEV